MSDDGDHEAADGPMQGVMTAPIEVRYHVDLESEFQPRAPEERKKMTLPEQIEEMRGSIGLGLGFPAPPIVATSGGCELPPRGYEIRVYDAPMAWGTMLRDGEAFVMADPKEVEAARLPVRGTEWPGRRIPGVIVGLGDLSRLPERQDGPRAAPMFHRKLFLDHLERTIRRNLWRLVGVQETLVLTEALRRSRPGLVDAVTPKPFSPKEVAVILAELLREQVPIRDLRFVFESLAAWPAGAQKRIDWIVEKVRRDLAPVLFARFAVDGRTVHYYAIGADVEVAFASAGENAMPEEVEVRVRNAFVRTIDRPRHSGFPAVVLVEKPEIRRLVRKFLEDEFPEVIVLVQRDLPRHLGATAIGVVTAGGAAAAARALSAAAGV